MSSLPLPSLAAFTPIVSNMTCTKAVICSLIGFTFVVLGTTIKKFYWAKGINSVSLSDRPTPTWLGRIGFICLGSLFLFLGLHYILFEQ